jgi:hypothetical protein
MIFTPMASFASALESDQSLMSVQARLVNLSWPMTLSHATCTLRSIVTLIIYCEPRQPPTTHQLVAAYGSSRTPTDLLLKTPAVDRMSIVGKYR